MELQFHKTVYPCLQQIRREVQNQEQTQEVRIPDGMPDVGRVLAAWGQILIRSKEWRSGTMGVSGGVMVWVLYTPEDGGESRSVETWIPFQMKWDLPETERDGTIYTVCLLRSADARSISARKIMVRTNVGVLAEALVPTDVPVYKPVEVPQDVQLLKNTYPMRLPKEAGEKIIQMEEELMMPSSGSKPDKILRYSLQPELVDQKVMAGKLVFRGAAILHILYRGEDGKLYNWDYDIPFSQYSELEQSYDNSAQARISLGVTNLELDMGDDDLLHLRMGLTGQYVVYDTVAIEVVEDAYSPRRPVTLIKQPLEMPMVLDDATQILHAEYSGDYQGEKVVDIAFYPDHAYLTNQADTSEAVLSGQFQMLSYDGEAVLQGTTVNWEDTKQITKSSDSIADMTVWPSGKPQGNLNSGSLYLRADMALNTIVTAAQAMEMVTGLDLADITEPDPNRPSLILRRMGDDSLWDIAKQYGSTVEAIEKANAFQTEPDGNRILLIPIP